MHLENQIVAKGSMEERLGYVPSDGPFAGAILPD